MRKRSSSMYGTHIDNGTARDATRTARSALWQTARLGDLFRSDPRFAKKMTFPQFVRELGRICRRKRGAFMVLDDRGVDHRFREEEGSRALAYAVRLMAGRLTVAPVGNTQRAPELTFVEQKNGQVARVWK